MEAMIVTALQVAAFLGTESGTYFLLGLAMVVVLSITVSVAARGVHRWLSGAGERSRWADDDEADDEDYGDEDELDYLLHLHDMDAPEIRRARAVASKPAEEVARVRAQWSGLSSDEPAIAPTCPSSHDNDYMPPRSPF